jgi:hypothetical protein
VLLGKGSSDASSIPDPDSVTSGDPDTVSIRNTVRVVNTLPLRTGITPVTDLI